MAGLNPSAAVPVLPARPTASTWTKKPGAVSQFRIRQVFRTITPQWSHRLYFAVAQPTRGWSLRLDYTDTNIAEIQISDTISPTRPARITRSPEAVPGKVIAVEASSWLLPRSGVAFTWATKDELPQTKQPEAVASSREG